MTEQIYKFENVPEYYDLSSPALTQSLPGLHSTMKLTLIALSALFAAAMAQDTFHCPDGWELHEGHGHCGCFLFGSSERVTREDADILCGFHDGAWVAEPSHPG